mgnify:CR=1 FL=1
MKYNILKYVTNIKEQYSASVSATFDNLDSAKVNYHSTLANLHNASDVKLACVKIVTEYGFDVEGYSEIVDHTTEETETAEE